MVNIICQTCNITVQRKNKNRKFCSHKCYSKSKEGRATWNKGLHGIYSKALLIKMSLSRKGKRFSPKTEFKKGQGFWTGKKRPNLLNTNAAKTMFKKGQTVGDKNSRWKGGITPEIRKIRNSTEYKIWRMEVFRRDRFKCVLCNYRSCKPKDISADHIKPFKLFPELRFDVNNGRTLCVSCHRNLETSWNRKLTRENFLW